MRAIKKILSQTAICLVFIILSSMVWISLFGYATDTSQDKKITIYIDCANVKDKELSVSLESIKPEGIKMIKVHPFSYAVFSPYDIENADIYILPRSKVSGMIDSFLTENDVIDIIGYSKEGLTVYNSGSASGILTEYITYLNDLNESEDFVLFFGVNSIHTGIGNSVDSAAIELVTRIITEYN